MASNSVNLHFHYRTSAETQAEGRALAVFIHAKLVAGGMDVTEARHAVQKMFTIGWNEGYEEGHDAGRADNYDSSGV